MNFISAETAFKVLNLTGTPYEMGVQHGTFLKEEIRHAIEQCLGEWGVKIHGWDKKAIADYAKKALSYASKRIQEEFQGIADGSGLALDDILAWNYVDDYYELYNCTAFAANNRLTHDGQMIVGRNNDYEDDFSNSIAVTIVRTPKDGIATLCNTWAGTLGSYEGINLKGLTLAIQFSETPDKDFTGKSIKQLCLEVLEKCSTVDEATDYIENASRNFGSNILLADTENMRIIECSGLATQRLEKNNDHIISTNHFCELKTIEPQPDVSFLTRERKAFVQRNLVEHVGALDVKAIKELLKKPPIGRTGGLDYYTTRCAIYQPAEGKAHIAHGLIPAFRGDFIQLNLNDLVKQKTGLNHYGVKYSKTVVNI